MSRMKDIEGRRFGSLTVLELHHRGASGRSYWLCDCDCGNRCVVCGTNLVTGHTLSCGCLQRKVLLDRLTTHGQSKTRLYRIWKKMRRRCNIEDDPAYGDYGGRGITVCEEWEDFPTFKQWADENGYSDKLTIDRINNGMGYSPHNCRWATNSMQANNRRSNRLVTYYGKTQNLKQWAKELGLDYKLVESRIVNLGWSVEDAFNTPSLKHSLTFEYAGEEHSIAEWARILGVTYNALYFRIKRGDLRDFEDYFDKL